MTFAEYLAAKGIGDPVAAEALGLHRTTIHNLRTGRRIPSIAVAAKIETWTKGKVKAATFAKAQDAA